MIVTSRLRTGKLVTFFTVYRYLEKIFIIFYLYKSPKQNSINPADARSSKRANCNIFCDNTSPHPLVRGVLYSRVPGLDSLNTNLGVAQIVAHRLAVRQARVRISARHPRGGPLPSECNEDTKSGSLRVVYINIV